MGASVSQVIGMMKEFIRPELPKLFPNEYLFYHHLFSAGQEGTPHANKPKAETGANARPYRVPLKLLQGFKAFTGNPDGGPLARGSGPTIDAGTLTPVYIYQAGEWTKSTEINTNSDKKSIENYATMMAKDALEQFNTLLDALIMGDGSFTLDTVVSTATNQLTVNNANMFYSNQDIDCWSALSGNFLGTVTILSVDGPNKQLNLTGPVPANVGAGTLLLLNGAAGVSNSGLFGVKYYQVQSSSGSVMNLQRSSYPGILSTPHVAAAGFALTPAFGRRLEGQMIAAMGVEYAEGTKLLALMNTDMAAAWENVAQQQTTIILNQVKGDSMPDAGKPRTPKSFFGHEILRTVHATTARIDLLHVDSFFKIESQPVDLYEVEGQTTFPIYGNNGAPLQSSASWYYTGIQVGNENVRKGAYADGFTAPTGF